LATIPPQAHFGQNSVPRPEHPRPDFVREPWCSLNGPWEFQFDPKNVGERRRWHRPTNIDDPFHRTILVPFPWESPLSGVCDTEYRGAAWYRREIDIPEEWRARGLHPVLLFGAVVGTARSGSTAGSWASMTAATPRSPAT
jgi:hypothetical protein